MLKGEDITSEFLDEIEAVVRKQITDVDEKDMLLNKIEKIRKEEGFVSEKKAKKPPKSEKAYNEYSERVQKLIQKEASKDEFRALEKEIIKDTVLSHPLKTRLYSLIAVAEKSAEWEVKKGKTPSKKPSKAPKKADSLSKVENYVEYQEEIAERFDDLQGLKNLKKAVESAGIGDLEDKDRGDLLSTINKRIAKLEKQKPKKATVPKAEIVEKVDEDVEIVKKETMRYKDLKKMAKEFAKNDADEMLDKIVQEKQAEIEIDEVVQLSADEMKEIKEFQKQREKEYHDLLMAEFNVIQVKKPVEKRDTAKLFNKFRKNINDAVSVERIGEIESMIEEQYEEGKNKDKLLVALKGKKDELGVAEEEEEIEEEPVVEEEPVEWDLWQNASQKERKKLLMEEIGIGKSKANRYSKKDWSELKDETRYLIIDWAEKKAEEKGITVDIPRPPLEEVTPVEKIPEEPVIEDWEAWDDMGLSDRVNLLRVAFPQYKPETNIMIANKEWEDISDKRRTEIQRQYIIETATEKEEEDLPEELEIEIEAEEEPKPAPKKEKTKVTIKTEPVSDEQVAETMRVHKLSEEGAREYLEIQERAKSRFKIAEIEETIKEIEESEHLSDEFKDKWVGFQKAQIKRLRGA